MDVQTVIVLLLGAGALFYLVRRYVKAAKNTGGCGCGCSGDCSAEKRNSCGSSENGGGSY